jgi:hypothetical protein
MLRRLGLGRKPFADILIESGRRTGGWFAISHRIPYDRRA